MKIGEAFVEVLPKTDKFGPQLKRDMEAGGKQAASGLTQALTAGAAVAGFSRLIGSASSLTEAANKVAVTFGESSGSVEQFASTSADSLGIAESAALSLAGGLGSMLIPLGISQEQAAEMSTTMLTLAADMGSFNDQDPTEMLERIRAGLAGESEPLRQYGANLSEARVQQFAWANGIADAGTQLDEQQKVMARYGLLLQDTSIQQGDFARTSESAANAQRRATATAEDSAAAIGENFIPVYEQALSVVQALAQGFGALPGPIQTGVVALGGYIALRAPIVSAFGSMAGSVAKLRSAVVLTQSAFLGAEVAASSAAGAMALSLGPWAALAAILVGIHTGLIDVTNAMSESDLDTANVDKMTAAMNEAGSASEGLINILNDPAEFDPSFFRAIDSSAEETATALLGTEAAWDTFVERSLGTLPEGSDLGAWNEALELHRTRALASADAMGEQGAAAEGAAGGLGENASAAQENAAAMDILTEAIDGYLDKIQGTGEANAAAAEAQQALFEGLIKNGATFDVNTAKGRENLGFINDWVDTVGGQVTAAADFAAANGNIDVAQRRANNAIQAGVGNLRALRDANVITQEQFRTYSDQLRGIPHDIRTQVTTPGAEESRQRVDDVTGAVKRMPKFGRTEITANNHQAMLEISEARRAAEAWAAMTYTAQLHASLSGALPGAAHGRRAAGGPVSAGRAYLVGEAGPELMIPGQSGTIIPNGGGGASVGMGGVTVVVEGNVIGDVDRFADEIAFRAAEKISRGAI